MATREISTRLRLDGEAEYSAALRNIASSMGNFKSEIALLNSQFEGQKNSYDFLVRKSELLRKAQELHAEKVKTYTKALTEAITTEDQYATKANELRKMIEDEKNALENLKKSTEDTTEAQKESEDTIARYEAMLNNMETATAKAANTVTDYSTKLNFAERDLNKLNSELDHTEQYMNEAANSADGYATSIDGAGKKVKGAADDVQSASQAMEALSSAFAAAGVTAGLKKLVDGFQDCAQEAIAFESAIAGVFKTVDGTKQQLQGISDGIQRLSTVIPTTTTELAGIAETAGQLGIATDDVLNFTEVMANMAVATNLSSEDAATQLARFANITGMAATDFERLGSTIVALGNNYATTESEIVAMGMRLASTGTLVKLNEAQIMALATTMSSLGISAEAGGTAISKLMQQFDTMVATGSDKLEQFAKVAGMSADEFAQVWKEDALSAIGLFIDGLGQVDSAGGSVSATLDELGIKQSQQVDAISRLATANGMLTDTVHMAGAAWAENTALTDEAAMRYGTLESKLQLLENSASLLKTAIGDALTPALENLAETGANAFQWMAEFAENNPEIVQGLAGVTAGLSALVAAFAAFSVIKTILPFLRAFNAALVANPILLAAAAAISLGVAVATMAADIRKASPEIERLNQKVDESKKGFEEWKESFAQESDGIDATVSAMEKLAEKTNKTAIEKKLLQTYIDELNEAIPGLSLAWDEETNALNMDTEAMEKRIATGRGLQEQSDLVGQLAEAEKTYAAAVAESEKAELALADAKLKGAGATSENSEATFASTYAASLGVSVLTEEELAYGKLQKAVTDASKTKEDAKKHLDDVNGAIEESIEKNGELSVATDEEAAAQKRYNKELSDTAELYGLTTDALQGMLDASGQTLDQWIAKQDAFAKATEGAAEKVVNGFQKVSTDTGMSLNEMISNVNANAAAYEEYTALMSELSVGMSDDTKAAFEKLGVGGLDALRQLKEGGAPAMEELNTAITNGAKAGVEDVKREYGALDITEEVTSVMRKASAVIEGDTSIETSFGTLLQKTTGKLSEMDLNAPFLTGIQKASIAIASDESMASTAEGQGKKVAEKLNDPAIPEAAGNAMDAAADEVAGNTTVASNAKIVAGNAAKSFASAKPQFIQAGRDMISGAINGANSMSASLRSAMARLAAQAIAAFKAALDSNSPSKKFMVIGEDSIEGYIIGLQAKESDAVNAAMASARSVLSAFEGEFKDYKSSLDFALSLDAISMDEYIAALEQALIYYDLINTDLNAYRSVIKEIHSYTADLTEEINKAYEAEAKRTNEAIQKVLDGYLTIQQAADLYNVSVGDVVAEVSFAKYYEQQMGKAVEAVVNGQMSMYEAVKEFGVNIDDLIDASEKHVTESNEDLYKKQRENLKYRYDMGLISTEEYYEALARLRDTFLEEDSAEWRRANVEQYNYYQQMIAQAEKATADKLKSIADKEAAAIKDSEKRWDEWLKNRKQQIKDELAAEKERINSIIDGINAEMQARKNLRSDEDSEDKIVQADAKVRDAEKSLAIAKAEYAHARDDNERIEAEKLVIQKQEALLKAQEAAQKARQDYEDKLWEREKKAEIDAEKAKIKDAEAAAKAAESAAEAEAAQGKLYDKLNIEDTYSRQRSAIESSSSKINELGEKASKAGDGFIEIAHAAKNVTDVFQQMRNSLRQGQGGGSGVTNHVSKTAAINIKPVSPISSGQISNLIFKTLDGM